MPTDQSCSNCLAFLADPDGPSFGTCHALPPRVLIDSAVGVAPTTVWPQVHASDWCLQWQAAPVAEEPTPVEDADDEAAHAPEPYYPREPEDDTRLEDQPPARSSHTRRKRR